MIKIFFEKDKARGLPAEPWQRMIIRKVKNIPADFALVVGLASKLVLHIFAAKNKDI